MTKVLGSESEVASEVAAKNLVGDVGLGLP